MLAPFDAYAIYHQWCLDTGHPPPTREWWDKACRQPRSVPTKVSDAQFDYDKEQQGDAQ